MAKSPTEAERGGSRVTPRVDASRPAPPLDTPAETRIRAPAKINLYLHVTGRREDGYHLLDSLVAFTELGDGIAARPSEGLSLELTGPYADALRADADNLVLRAAAALAGEFGIRDGAAITLTKNLPVAAGIGGGSADAAATLRALAALWRIEPDEAAMAGLAASLGADVPVCLHGRPARMSGIGEVIEPAPALPSCAVLLVNPNRPLSTPDVFAARHGAFSEADPIDDSFGTAAALAEALRARRNDLAPPAMELSDDIARVMASLEAAPDCLLARLSGSGPTCFGLFESEAVADAAAKRIAEANPAWWVRSTRFLADKPRVNIG